MIDLTQVLTFSEAAEKWGFASGNTLRKAVERKRFNPDEIRKSGDTWLTTYEAMVRVFGLPRKAHHTLSLYEMGQMAASSLYSENNYNEELDKMMDSIQEAVSNNEVMTIIEKDDPSNIISIIKTQEDLENFLKVMKRYLSNFKK